jgi:CO dehydrogenase/acetyl-CoA synthase alpha subunit
MTMAFCTIISANVFAAADDWQPLLDVAFEQNDLEMAVMVLVNDNNVPVSDIIAKAREMGFGYTRIVDALIDTKLSCEQVMIDALLNNVPPAALFDSKIIRDDYHYTPELILQFLVKEMRFMEQAEESLGEKDDNAETKKRNMDVILRVAKAMMDDKSYSQYDVMSSLCKAGASNALIAETAKAFDVPQATTFKACPKHAEYGQAYISNDLPQEAYIIIGVDHLTVDDNSGRGVISPKRP